jgi:hypothetical protein
MGGHQIRAFRRNFNTTENKSEQALQIIGHVVAEFYANKRLMHGRSVDNLWSQKPLYNKSYLMNFRRCVGIISTFCDYYLTMEKIYEIKKQ